jgi:transcriptional regulator with XRE-family HTH domain
VLTIFGKELRKLRIDRDERLLDMAERLKISSSFISALEAGKKPLSANFEELVIKAYSLAGDAADAIRRAADASRRTFSISPSTALGRDTAGLLARHMDTLSEKQLREIKNILEKKL